MADINFEELGKLVIRYQNGDGKAFEDIYNMTFRTAKFTALKILNNNEADAEDVIQDCYIKAIDKIDSLKDPTAFMSWFNMIIANRAKSYIRKNNPHFYEKDQEEDYSNLDDIWAKEFQDYIQPDENENDDVSHSDSNQNIGQSKKLSFADETLSEDYESFLP